MPASPLCICLYFCCPPQFYAMPCHDSKYWKQCETIKLLYIYGFLLRFGNVMVILKNWYVTGDPDDPYTAPERRSRRLVGQAYGHPNYKDGEPIVTSVIVAAEGRKVTTKSREYTLEGPPESGYVEYLKQIGYTLDEENPVKIHYPNNPDAN